MGTPEPGLCGDCRWARAVVSDRGSRFLRCGRADDDPSFPRYPALPVRECPGFSPAPRVAGGRERTANGGPGARSPGAIPLTPAATAADPITTPGPESTLFRRIGGRPTVERLVAEFYARIERDPELRPLFPADLGPGREKQALFLEQWLGGEPRYSALYGHPRLRRRHFPFVIDERAAGRWLHHMAEATRAAGIAAPERTEIVRGLGPLARHMTNAGDDVPRAPIEDPRLS